MFGRSTELKKYNYTQEELDKFAYAKFITSKGEIIIKLTPQYTPNTVANFATLANDGELFTYRHKGFWKCMDSLRDKRELDELATYSPFIWNLFSH